MTERGKYKNIDFFDNIDNEEKAYWLGFIYADGYIICNKSSGIYRLGIELAAKDHKHLKKLADIFGREIKYKTRFTNFLKSYEQANLIINNKIIYNSVVNLGITNLKTTDNGASVLEKIPEELFRHFVRGLFDGDGSISERGDNSYQFSICGGSQEFLANIQSIIIDQISLNKTKIAKNSIGESYYIVYSGRRQLQKIFHWFYDDSILYLERKKNIFNQLVKDWNNFTQLNEWCKFRDNPEEFHDMILELIKKIPLNKYKNIFAIPRGGIIIGVYLSHHLEIPMITDKNDITQETLIVDDLADTGTTLKEFAENNFDIATIYYKTRSTVVPTYYVDQCPNNFWIVFNWEKPDEIPNREVGEENKLTTESFINRNKEEIEGAFKILNNEEIK